MRKHLQIPGNLSTCQLPHISLFKPAVFFKFKPLWNVVLAADCCAVKNPSKLCISIYADDPLLRGHGSPPRQVWHRLWQSLYFYCRALASNSCLTVRQNFSSAIRFKLKQSGVTDSSSLLELLYNYRLDREMNTHFGIVKWKIGSQISPRGLMILENKDKSESRTGVESSVV